MTDLESSLLTWDNVLEAIRKACPSGITNHELQELFKAARGRVEHLTLIMWEAKAIFRSKEEDGMAWRYHL